MTAANGKTFFILSMLLALAWCQQQQQQQLPYGNDSEFPTVLSYNSPLRQPDSLKSRPYFDFLSTLYRRDADKNQLFRPYVRARRETMATQPLDHNEQQQRRSKRAIVFRPLFVYRKQQVRKQNQRKRRT